MLPGLCLPPLFGAGASDVAPTTVDWADIASGGWGSGTEQELISGIGTPIMLRVEISSVIATGSAGGSIVPLVNGTPVGGETLADGATYDFEVDPEDYVSFYFPGGGSPFGWTFSFAVAVKYKSAGSGTFDQTLDSFTVALAGP